MSRSWIAAVVIAPTLLLGAEKQSCPSASSSSLRVNRSLAQVYQQLSVTAEAVAPSGGRHRAVQPPKKSAIVYPPKINFVDTEIFGKMEKDGIAPAPLSSDEELLRRASIDIAGQIPSPATVKSFVADTAADKRTKMIDSMLASDGYVDRWTMWFGDLVQNVRNTTNSREGAPGRNAYYNFIRTSIRDNKPYDQLVREIIMSSGDSYAEASGGTNYWIRQIQPNGPIQDTWDNLASHSGEKFLGMPVLCLSCHNGLGHLESVNTYLRSKSRYEFWGSAAFFSRTRTQAIGATGSFQLTQVPNGNYLLNTVSGNKSPRQPVNGQSTVPPTFFLTGEGPRTGEEWRTAYARILTAHPQFARATVNYVWKEMFGLGIVEPTNNIDMNRLDPAKLAAGQTLQPTHPALLEQLTTEFIANKFDFKWLVRTIAVSNAYQLSTKYTASEWSETWTPYFARHLPDRLTAEQLLDAVATATAVPITYTVQNSSAVTQAMKLPDTLEGGGNAGRFLDSFGRGNRDDEPRDGDPSIVQALGMMNDNTMILPRIRRTTNGSTVQKALAASTDPAVIVETLYLATLSRYPTESEKTQTVAYLRSGTLANKTEDLQWALLNSLEFLFN
jgi:Protein of unknown function (DUF1549)/Protein of unknown function (DUF1553)